MAPPGCDAFYVLAPVPHLDSGTDWQALAATAREAKLTLVIYMGVSSAAQIASMGSSSPV